MLKKAKEGNKKHWLGTVQNPICNNISIDVGYQIVICQKEVGEGGMSVSIRYDIFNGHSPRFFFFYFFYKQGDQLYMNMKY